MSREKQPIDEYTLAAFLSGTLPQDRRHEVMVYLAENADARELLCMAGEAMEATQQPVTEPFTLPQKTTAPPRREDRAPTTAATPSPLRKQRLRQATLGAVVVVFLSVGLYVGLPLNKTDTVRGNTLDDGLTVQVSTPALQFEWNEVEDAYYYSLVIWDVDAAELVAQHETKSTRLGRNDAFVLSLHRDLEMNRRYEARIDALDVQNRRIQSSKMVEFSLQE